MNYKESSDYNAGSLHDLWCGDEHPVMFCGVSISPLQNQMDQSHHVSQSPNSLRLWLKSSPNKDLEPQRHNNIALAKFVFEFEVSMATKEAVVALSYPIDFLIMNVIDWLWIFNHENIFSNKRFSRFHEFKLKKPRLSRFNQNFRICG